MSARQFLCSAWVCWAWLPCGASWVASARSREELSSGPTCLFLGGSFQNSDDRWSLRLRKSPAPHTHAAQGRVRLCVITRLAHKLSVHCRFHTNHVRVAAGPAGVVSTQPVIVRRICAQA